MHGGVIAVFVFWVHNLLFLNRGILFFKFQNTSFNLLMAVYEYNQFPLVYLKTMKRTPNYSQMLHQKEVQALQDQLQDSVMELSGKDARIFQLEERISEMENRERINMINTQETVHRYISERLKHGAQENRQLQTQLRQRQKYQEGIQLSLQEKDRQIRSLKEMVTAKEKEMANLLETVSNEMAIQSKSIEDMGQEINRLRAECACKEEQLGKRQLEVIELKREGEQKTSFLKEKNLMLYQKIAQLQKGIVAGQQMVDQVESANEQCRADLNLAERNREHVTNLVNYCKSRLTELQGEMGQADREKREMEALTKRLQVRLSENENVIREYRFQVRSLQEDGTIMREEIGELKEKIQRHEGEINDLYSLKLKNYMRIKDAEKDVARLGSALYEKEQEIVSAKSKLCDCEQQQLEMGSSLVEKNAQIKHLQQVITEKDKTIHDQSEKLEQFSRNMDYIDKKMQEDSLIKIFMAKDHEEKFHSLQKEKQQRLNEMSGKMIEREVEACRKIERLKKQLQEKTCLKISLKQMEVVKGQLQAEVAGLKEENASRDERYHSEVVGLRQALAEKEQSLALMEIQLEQKDNELLALKETNKDLTRYKNDFSSVFDSLNADISNLKHQNLTLNQNYAALNVEQEQLNSEIFQLIGQKDHLSAKLQKQSVELDARQQKLNELNQLTEASTQNFEHILEKLEQCDDSEHFQILDHDEFVLIDSKESRVKELIRKMEEFRCAVASLSTQ